MGAAVFPSDSPIHELVIDASVLINICASSHAPEVFAALPERIVVMEEVVREVEAGRERGYRTALQFENLRERGVVEVETLGDSEKLLFEQLVRGSTVSTLDDGEAATLARAVVHSSRVALDEKKARRICAEQFTDVDMQFSVELLRHPSVRLSLGPERLSSVVADALREGCMHVPTAHHDWVIEVLPPFEPGDFPSLPSRLAMGIG